MKGTVNQDIYPINITSELLERLYNGEIIKKYDSPYIIQLISIKDFGENYPYYLKRVFNNNNLINLQNKCTVDNLIYSLFIALLGMIMLWIVVNHLLKPLTYLEKKTRKTLQKREEKLKKLSFHDSLTNLYNRHYLEHLFKDLDDNHAYPITILIADLDGLKEINDINGHFEGDKYIKKNMIEADKKMYINKKNKKNKKSYRN